MNDIWLAEVKHETFICDEPFDSRPEANGRAHHIHHITLHHITSHNIT